MHAEREALEVVASRKGGSCISALVEVVLDLAKAHGLLPLALTFMQL